MITAQTTKAPAADPLCECGKLLSQHVKRSPSIQGLNDLWIPPTRRSLGCDEFCDAAIYAAAMAGR